LGPDDARGGRTRGWAQARIGTVSARIGTVSARIGTVSILV
jgi:hypothetical protein